VPSVLLIDDHAMFREGLALALGQAAGPSLHLRTAASGAQALDLLKEGPADIALMDYYLPDIGGAALAAGAHGFLHKSADAVLRH